MPRYGDTPSTYIFGADNVIICAPYLEDNHKKYETASGRLELYFEYLAKQATANNKKALFGLTQKHIRRAELEFQSKDNKPAVKVNVEDIYNKNEAFKRLCNYCVFADHLHDKHEYVLAAQECLKERKLADGMDDLLLPKFELEDLKEHDYAQLSELRQDFERLVRDLHIFRYLTKHGKFSVDYIRDIWGGDAVNEDSFLWQAYEILRYCRENNIESDEAVADAIFCNFTDALDRMSLIYNRIGIKPQELGFTELVSNGIGLQVTIDDNCKRARALAAGGEEKLNELFKTAEQRKQLRAKVRRLNQDGSMNAELLCDHASFYTESPDVRKRRASKIKADLFCACLCGVLICCVLGFAISFFICSMIAIAGAMAFLTGLYISLGVCALVLICNVISLACFGPSRIREMQISEEKKISFAQDAKEMVNLLSCIDVPELKSSDDMLPIHAVSAMRDPECNYAEYKLSGEEWLIKLDENAGKHNVGPGLKQLVQDRADSCFAESENRLAQNKSTKESQMKIDTRLDAVETKTAGATQPSGQSLAEIAAKTPACRFVARMEEDIRDMADAIESEMSKLEVSR